MKRRGIITLIILGLFLIFVAIKLINNKKIINESQEVVDRTHIPISVNVAEAKIVPLEGKIKRPAIVSPNETARVAATMNGLLTQLSISLGDYVRKGEKIGKIDTRTLNIQQESLELAVEKLERDYKRNKELYEGNALSESNFLDSKFAYKSRKIELKQLKQQISNSYIESPLSGVVTTTNYVKGEFVTAGSSIATIVNTDILKINVFVNSNEVRYIKKEQQVKITAAVFPDTVFSGIVTFISPNADDNFNYKIQIEVDTKKNPQLIAGTYVDVIFESKDKEEALQIPKKALVEGVKNAYVYIRNGDRAEKRKIEVGRMNGNKIEVISGLKEGEEVVTDGQVNIVDNSLIQVKENK